MQFCNMLKKLQQRWKVNSWNLLLIIFTFALGGSACARLGEKILLLIDQEKNAIWWILYLLLITILWPICVLLISIPLGQFVFFRNYTWKILQKFRRKERGKITRIAIFASGKGSNANNIISYFENITSIKVALIVTNNPSAGVIEVAKKNKIDVLLLDKQDLIDCRNCIEKLQSNNINLIVLAGFLKKIPDALINAYQKRIINIHPALLPKFGGKGMYGSHVHEAVIANNEPESGITIHYVDSVYDNGEIIFQAFCKVDPSETPESLAKKIHDLEYAHFPKIIKEFVEKQMQR